MTHPGYFDHVHFCSSFFISFIFYYKYTIVKITNFGASYIYKFTNKAKGLCTCCSRIQCSLRDAARHLMGPGESPDGNRSSRSPWKLIYRNCTIFYINVQSTKEKFRLSSLFYHHILYLVTKQENFSSFSRFFCSRDHSKHLFPKNKFCMILQASLQLENTPRPDAVAHSAIGNIPSCLASVFNDFS